MAKKNGEKTFTIGNKEYEVEKVECPKCEGKGCDHCEGKGYHEEGFNIKEGYKPVKQITTMLKLL